MMAAGQSGVTWSVHQFKNKIKKYFIMGYSKELNDIVETINSLPDQQERINYLIEFAEEFKSVPAEIAEKPYPVEKRVEYCESEAYVWVNKTEDENYNLYFAIENPSGVSAKALCAILQQTLNGKSREEILSVNTDLVLKLFGNQLSMGKNLGLTGIIQSIHKQVKNS